MTTDSSASPPGGADTPLGARPNDSASLVAPLDVRVHDHLGAADAGEVTVHLGTGFAVDAGRPDVDAGRSDDVDPPMSDADLRRRLETLPVIEQAKGILMATLGVDADTAFGILRQRSSHSNLRLREIARLLVLETVRRGAPGGPV